MKTILQHRLLPARPLLFKACLAAAAAFTLFGLFLNLNFNLRKSQPVIRVLKTDAARLYQQHSTSVDEKEATLLEFDSEYHIFTSEEVEMKNLLPIVLFVCDRNVTTTLDSLQTALLNYTSLEQTTFVHFKVIVSYDRPNDALRHQIAEASTRFAQVLQEQQKALGNRTGYTIRFIEVLHDVESCTFVLPAYAAGMLHGRNAIRLKCHWYWLQRMLFSVNAFKRNVLYFEDDHWVSPDALVVLEQLIQWKDTGAEPVCAVSLSYNGRSYSQETAEYHLFDVIVVDFTFPNAGYVFNQTFFNMLNSVINHFFAIDSHWDNSIGHLGFFREISPPFMIIPQRSRVHHYSKTGLTMNEALYKAQFENALFGTQPASAFVKSKAEVITKWKYNTELRASEEYSKKLLCTKDCTRCDECQFCREKAKHHQCTIQPRLA